MALGLAGIGFDLLEQFNDSVGLPNVNNRHISDDSCDEQQAPHDVLHRNLPREAKSKSAVIIHKAARNAILEFPFFVLMIPEPARPVNRLITARRVRQDD
jgi:hypothetical protein